MPETIESAMKQIESLVSTGLLDRHWGNLVVIALRRQGDDEYDPDVRVGNWVDDLVDERRTDRDDLSWLLETVMPWSGDLDDDEIERVNEIAERIGWTP